jgi:hypothetical protein
MQENLIKSTQSFQNHPFSLRNTKFKDIHFNSSKHTRGSRIRFIFDR